MSNSIAPKLSLELSLSQHGENNIFEYIQNGVLITNCQSEVIYTNPAFSRITEYTAEELMGQNPGILHSGRQDKKFYEVMWQDLTEHGYWEGEIWNRRKSGVIYPAYLTISALIQTQNNICNYISVSSDITYLKKDVTHQLMLAFYDPLTELPNRALYRERVAQSVKRAELQDKSVHAIMFMDLDTFKQVNDTYGHLVGDQLLKLVGQRLSSIIRSGDTVARIGGDEFTAILNNIQSKMSVEQLAARFVESIEKPFKIDGHDIRVSISIGISFYPGDDKDIEKLLDDADKAMYEAKKRKCKIMFYDELPQQSKQV